MFSRFAKYFDYASQTPVDGRVLRVVDRASRDLFHNPGALYSTGVLAAKKLEEARKKVATLCSGVSKNSVHSDEIIFTSGGTESNNIAVQGVIEKWYETHNHDHSKKPHVIISQFEHPSLNNIVEHLQKKDVITFSKIKIDTDGILDLKELKDELIKHPSTILVSVMLVNNEIGTIQPIRDVASLVRKAKAGGEYPLLHTDACQAVNYLDMPVDKMGADLITYDASKFYGPKGIGMLYVKRNTLVSPVYFGGDQERGMRPGTENVPAILGMVKALEIAYQTKAKETGRIHKLQQYAFKKISKMRHVSINGSIDQEKRIANNVNICFPGQDSEFLLFKLDVAGFQVSTGTTCQNKKEDSKSVSVEALSNGCESSSLRITLGRYTTIGQVRGLVRAISKI